MTHRDADRVPQRFTLEPEAARRLQEHGLVRDLDRAGCPHFLVKVPSLDQAAAADLGLEVDRDADGCISLSILIYDIPTEPVTHEVRLRPEQPADLRFLWRVIEAAQLRIHLCQPGDQGWEVGPPETFRLPSNVLMRIKQYSLQWPRAEEPEAEPAPPEEPAEAPRVRSPDPRDTVIRKLKEQVHTLRAQVQDRDKRIIELEDELHEIKSRGRGYRLTGEKKPWWKPFV